ncbi:ABC transporter permease subunit [Virgibacillus phasianinus]|nr:ABC transporter permease subunit [Virgibacillus phasianinus]
MQSEDDTFVDENRRATLWLDFWKKFQKQKPALVSGVFILLLFIIAIIGPILAPYGVAEPDYNHILEGPSAQHIAGTDAYGRDIFSRIIVGSRISLLISISSVFVGAALGSILGLISGFYGRWIDSLIMRACDVLFSFPGMLLAIGIIAILGPGITNVVIAISIFTIPTFARIVRSGTLSAKQSVFVEAARSIGATNKRIIWKHIFPETVSSIIVYFTMRIGNAILVAASLGFLGLGAKPPTPEWGAMLSMGRDYISTDPHITFFPGLAIFLTVLAFNLLGDGLRDALDPKIKN